MRTLRRLAIVVGLLFTLLLAFNVGYKLYGIWRLDTARAAFEREVGSLDWESYGSPDVADEENFIAALWALLPNVPTASRELSKVLSARSDDPDRPWSVDELGRLRHHVERSSGLLARAHAAAKLPHASLRLKSPGDPLPVPADDADPAERERVRVLAEDRKRAERHAEEQGLKRQWDQRMRGRGGTSELTERWGPMEMLPYLFAISDLLAAEAIVAIEDGDEARAVESLAVLARLVREVRSASGALVLQMYGDAYERQWLRSVGFYVGRPGELRESDRLLSVCAAIDLPDSFRRALASEGAWIKGRWPNVSLSGGVASIAERILALLLPFTARDAEAGALDAHRETQRLSTRPYVEWRETHEDPDLSTRKALRFGTPYAFLRQTIETMSRQKLRDEQILRDARRLARASLRLRGRLGRGESSLAGLLEPSDRSAISGGELVVEALPDGRHRLTFQGALEALEPLRKLSYGHQLERSFALLSWTVAAPEASRPGDS